LDGKSGPASAFSSRDRTGCFRTSLVVTDASLAVAPAAPDATLLHRADGGARLQAAFSENYDFLWRLLRRFGVPAADADDAAQQVFMTFVRKMDRVEPGKERSFLYGTALKVAANWRRASKRRQVVAAPEPSLSACAPDELAESARARALLDEILDQLPDELRRVLVLAEIEQYQVDEIADLERLPVGTAASRLRRARKQFRELLAVYGDRNPFGRGAP
jgi:RNA polymerase sigma-70 factor (ECF subfamily)